MRCVAGLLEGACCEQQSCLPLLPLMESSINSKINFASSVLAECSVMLPVFL